MWTRKLGPSSGKCRKCGASISINPPRPCYRCSGEKNDRFTSKEERTFTESEVRAMFQVLRANEFFDDGGATLMHLDDFNARVQSFFSDPS